MEGESIRLMEARNGKWTAPQTAPLSLSLSDEPSFSPDGETLFFLCADHSEERPNEFDENVRKVTRTHHGQGAIDLYVSFRGSDGVWMPARPAAALKRASVPREAW